MKRQIAIATYPIDKLTLFSLFLFEDCYVLRIKISVNTDISVIGFYGNIENISKISMDIFTKISVIKFFHILII